MANIVDLKIEDLQSFMFTVSKDYMTALIPVKEKYPDLSVGQMVVLLAAFSNSILTALKESQYNGQQLCLEQLEQEFIIRFSNLGIQTKE